MTPIAPEPTYALTLSSGQARLMARALDFWCRVRMGQLEALEAAVRPRPGPSWAARAGGDRPAGHIDWDALREALAVVRGEMFPWLPPDASDLDFPGGRESFNLRKVIEHCVSWHESPLKPGEMPTVNYDGPIAEWWPTPFHARMVPVSEVQRDA